MPHRPRDIRLPARYSGDDIIMDTPPIRQTSTDSNVPSMPSASAPPNVDLPVPAAVSCPPTAPLLEKATRVSGNSWEGSSRPHNAPVIEERETPAADMVPDELELELDDTFGLDHTPEYDGGGMMGENSDEETTKARWFPSGVVGPPTFDDLSDCVKMILILKLTKISTIKNAFSYIMLTNAQITDFFRIYEREYTRNKTKDELIKAAVNEIIRRRMERGTDISEEERQEIIDKELKKLPTKSALLSIEDAELDKAVRFLRNFRVQEELSGIQDQTPDGVDPRDIPPLLVIEEIIKEMQIYKGSGKELMWDCDFEMGVRDYIITQTETEMAGGIDDIVLSDEEEIEEEVEEVEQPTRRPGRPSATKPRGRKFANKPPRKKSSLIKLRLPPSKLQQMQTASDTEGNGEGPSSRRNK